MRKNQSGFAIGAILMAIVLLAAVAGAIALGGRNRSSNSSDQSAVVTAATVVQEANNLRAGFDVMLARGTTLSTITFDNAATTGLLNPTTGGAELQTLPAAATSTNETWQYKNGTVKIVGIGTDAGGDYVVIVSSVKDTVCQQIMKSLYNTTTLPASGIAASAWRGSSVDLTAGVSGIDNRPSGCVTTTDGADKNVFYSVMAAQ